MLFTEREPFVHSGAQSDDSAWNKSGTSFGTKLWQRSHVVGWKSTSSNIRRRLRRVLERNRDVSPIENKHRSKIARCRFQFLSYLGSSICGLLDFTKSV